MISLEEARVFHLMTEECRLSHDQNHFSQVAPFLESKQRQGGLLKMRKRRD